MHDAFVPSFRVWVIQEISTIHPIWISTKLIQNLNMVLTCALLGYTSVNPSTVLCVTLAHSLTFKVFPGL